jgi:hypothetical protein
MTPKNIALIGAALYSVAFTHTLTASPLELPQYGFAIEVLDACPSTTTSTIAFITFLPSDDGFAPNINVNIQPYDGTMASYIAMSKEQFKQMNWTIISERKNGDNEWTVEYSGQMQGSNLHYYARAVSNSGKVFLVTATAKASQWIAVSDVLRKHVDSFKTK